jgi:uncharacterized protein YjdB
LKEEEIMRSIRKYIAGALSAAMIMTSAFAQGAVVSYAEEQDVGIVATAGDAEADGVEMESAIEEEAESALKIGLGADIEESEIVEEEMDVQGDSGVTDSGLKYSVSSNDEITITGYSGTATEIDIPGEIDGKKVVCIGENAFYRNSSMTGISIPDSVTSIEDSAFSGCSGLTNITIPDSVNSLGFMAFGYCTGLTSISIPNSVTSMGYAVFWECSNLISASIPDSVTSIGNYTFSGCSSLTSVTIPNSLTEIGKCFFYNCSELTSISIPSTVTSIGVSAFSGCSSLISINIPDGVTSIGGGAFSSCSSLTSINIPDGVTSIGDAAFRECSSLTSIYIPANVTSIGDYVLFKCTGLTSIKVENGNTVYDSRNGCNALIETSSNKLLAGCRNTNIPDGVTSIGYYAFYECIGLTSISMPNSITSIGTNAFGECLSLTSVTMSDSLTDIDQDAFYGCHSLTSVTLPDSVTNIGYSAFRYCSALTSITVPDSVTSIGDDAFFGCTYLTIICNRNSIAYKYAIDNKISYKIIGEPDTIPVTDIKLNKITTIVKGETITLKATVSPDDATDKTVTWKSDNTKVATVDEQTGKVTAVSTGTVTITCTATDGSGVTKSCTITVTTPVTKVKLDATSKTIAKGNSVTLTAKVTPAKAYQNVTWKSSNTKVATVSSSGKVTAKKVGKATITCTAADGSGKKATCKITVTTPVTKIKLNKTKATLKKGKSVKLKATVTPSKACKKVTWKSSNTKVATVSSSGKVTAKKKGTATITCTAADGSGKKVTCKITVK